VFSQYSSPAVTVSVFILDLLFDIDEVLLRDVALKVFRKLLSCRFQISLIVLHEQ
jgi:hypothetical protein